MNRIACLSKKPKEFFNATADKISLDSSYISLPNNMENMYKGYGTSHSGYESNTKSGIKPQVLFDYLNQTLDQLNMTKGVR